MRWRFLAAGLAAISIGPIAMRPQFEERLAQFDAPPSEPHASPHGQLPVSHLREAVREVDHVVATQPVPRAPIAQFRGEAADSFSLVESRERTPGEATGRGIAARFEPLRGIVLTEGLKPLPHSAVRLRDLETGHLAATVAADDSGRFTFSGLHVQSWAAAATVPLLLEVLDFGGRVIATVVPRVQQFDELELQLRVPGTVVGERPVGDLESYLEELAAAADRSGFFGLLGRAPPASPSR